MEDQGLKINLHQIQLETIMEGFFTPLHFPQEVCDWMKNTLLEKHGEDSKAHSQQTSSIKSRLTMIESHMKKAYDDKLQGVIDEELWRDRNRDWRIERDQLVVQLDGLNKQSDDYIDRGVLLIELAQRTVNAYKKASPENKRKLVEIVSSNRFLSNGTIQFDYRKPFDVLSKIEGSCEKWT